MPKVSFTYLYAVLFSLFMFTGSSWGQSLESFTKKFNAGIEELDAPLEGLKEKYVSGLKRLQENEQRAGNLENVLAIKKEIEQLKKGVSKEVVGFGSFNRLQRIYQRENVKLTELRRTQTMSLASKYREELKGLQTELTKSNQVNEALKVNGEIKRIDSLIATTGSGEDPKTKMQESKNLKDSKLERIKGFFMGKKWGTQYAAFTFNPDGTGIKEWKMETFDINWTIQNDGLVKTEGGGPPLLWRFDSKKDGEQFIIEVDNPIDPNDRKAKWNEVHLLN